MKYKHYIIIAIVLVAMGLGSCKKGNEVGTLPPSAQATFAGNTTLPYYVQNLPGDKIKIPVGITTVLDKNTRLTYTISSPTGAAVGAQYDIPNINTVIIPAGKAVDSITVNGLFAGFPGNRKDTLIFTLTGGDVPASQFNKALVLVMNKFCPVNLSSFTGAYTRCFDTDATTTYSRYTATISSVTPGATPTTGSITIQNFWDVGGTPVVVDLDWTNPASFKTTVRSGLLYVDAQYGQASIAPVGTGTFSSCDNTFTMSYRVTVSAGSFGNFTTTMAR